MTNFEQCRLCRQPKVLRKSHVIPEFVYRTLYDKKSRAEALDGGSGRKRTIQSGHYERLLCEDCEQVFQPDERYLSQLWFFRDPLPDPVEGVYVERKNFEYDPFFRFHLSVLWRASISRAEQFSAVSLGPYEEPYRAFLNREESLKHEPGIFGLILRRPGSHELWNRIIVAPTRSRLGGTTITYHFVFRGVSWHYCVSPRRRPLPDSLRLKRPGSIILPVLDYTEDVTISRAWKKWKQSQERH